MNNQCLRSLARAKYEILHNKILSNKSWCNAEIYKPGKYAFYKTPYRIKVHWWNNRAYNATLKIIDKKGKINFLEFNIPGSFPENWDRQLENLDAYIMSSLVFDKICRLSDDGYSIGYSLSELCKKKEYVEIIQPYEGSKMQIEADMMAPDFAYLDEPKIALPF